jgi:hypothetical protein
VNRTVEMYLNDIVEEMPNSVEHIDNIVNAFVEQQESFGNIINEKQKSNIQALTKILYNTNKSSEPIVVNIPMGQGKSTLLVEFIRYMHKNDKEFGCIVVKKTLAECEDFCIAVGMEEEKEEMLEFTSLIAEEEAKSRLQLLRRHYLCNVNEHGTTKPKVNEGDFIARSVRGFNFKDCTRYVDKSKIWGIHPDAVDYDYRLCSGCDFKGCPVKLSRWYSKKHRVLTITHNRLFFSADREELIKDLLEFENEQGEVLKRQLLIIDEKLDTVDIGNITYKEFTSLKSKVIKSNNNDFIKLFQSIDDFILGLEYPLTMKSNIIPQKKVFQEGFLFREEMINTLLSDNSITLEDAQNINILQKILSCSNISANIHFPSKDRQVSYYHYIDLNDYTKLFNKTVLLDATSKLDFDYRKSSITLVKDIQDIKSSINLYEPKYKLNINKGNVIGRSIKFKNPEEREAYYSNTIQLLANELGSIINCKTQDDTLIVVYKEIDKYKFKDDITNELKKLQLNHEYKVIHHGEFSTGVNHLSNYENLIILGQLNKSHTYYQNKSLALGLDTSNYLTVQVNDYLIQNIQQIGRTALRKGKSVNVFMLCDEPSLVQQLKGYFDAQSFVCECTSYTRELTALERIIDAVEEVLINEGDIVAKSKISEIAQVDVSTLRKPYVKDALSEIGVITKGDNNRYFIKQ